LDDTPRSFYNKNVYTSGVKFEYAIKTKASLLSPEPERPLREKGRDAIRYLENVLEIEAIDKKDLHDKISSYNPYWIRKGFKSSASNICEIACDSKCFPYNSYCERY
jgi:hypothetical protein